MPAKESIPTHAAVVVVVAVGDGDRLTLVAFEFCSVLDFIDLIEGALHGALPLGAGVATEAPPAGVSGVTAATPAGVAGMSPL